MKQFLLFLMTAALVFSFVGCEKESGKNPADFNMAGTTWKSINQMITITVVFPDESNVIVSTEGYFTATATGTYAKSGKIITGTLTSIDNPALAAYIPENTQITATLNDDCNKLTLNAALPLVLERQ